MCRAPFGTNKTNRDPVSVTFGSTSGNRPTCAKGLTKTSVKKVGRGDEAEYLTYEAVNLQGSADVKAPVVSTTIAADSDNDGIVAAAGLDRGPRPRNVQRGGSVRAKLYVMIGDGEFTFEIMDLDDPSEQGKRNFRVDLLLERPSNQVHIIALDESGNYIKGTKTVTTSFDFDLGL